MSTTQALRLSLMRGEWELQRMGPTPGYHDPRWLTVERLDLARALEVGRLLDVEVWVVEQTAEHVQGLLEEAARRKAKAAEDAENARLMCQKAEALGVDLRRLRRRR